MSNINNHGVGMNKINLAGDFQELTCEQAAAIQGGAIILAADENFGGGTLLYAGPFSGGFPNVGASINDKTTSAKVLTGVWLLCEDANYQGNCVVVGPGEYPNLQFDVGLTNDSLSSLKRIDDSGI